MPALAYRWLQHGLRTGLKPENAIGEQVRTRAHGLVHRLCDFYRDLAYSRHL
jgi:hypothetical protein